MNDTYGDVSVALDSHVATVEIHRPPHNFFDARLIGDIANALVQSGDIVGLVVDGHDDRDEGQISHDPSRHRESTEPCGRPRRQLISAASILWPR